MKKFLLFFIGLSMIACENSKKESEKSSSEDSVFNISLHAFDGGTINANKLEMFSQDTTYAGQSKQFADAYYVISHPKGNLMWDAGLPESFVGQQPFTDPSGAFTVSRKDSLKNQLKSIDMTVDSIDYIALSHSHFDHIGHANALKNATWLVQENEYNFFTNDSAKVQQADIYNAIKELTQIKKLNGDYDVFGDGRVIIKSMPGHTIGHQVLYVDLGMKQPILLTGDLYHFEENRENKGVPIFNYNVEQTIKSMEDFESFAKEKNALVFIQHSPKDFERLKQIIKN